MMDDFYPVLAAAGLLAYAVMKLRLNRIAQPLRLQLAERGRALLADASLPRARHDMVKFEMESAFGRSWLLLVAIPVIPFFAMWCVLSGDERFRISDDAVRGRVDAFDELSTRLDFLNHPILMPVVYAWMALWLIPVMIVAAVIGRAVRLSTPTQIFAALHSRA